MKRFFYLLMLSISFVACKQKPQGWQAPECLSYSDVSVSGDLHDRMMRNMNRLEEEKYFPQNVYLTEEQSGDWAGDTEGRTILALVLEAQATGRTPKYLDSIMLLYPQKVNKKGYLGTIHEGVAHEQQLSGHGWLLRGLCEYYLWKKDEKVLTYINDIIDNLVMPTKGMHTEYPTTIEQRTMEGGMAGTSVDTIGKWILSSDIGCDMILLDGVVQAYEVTKRQEIVPIIEEMLKLALSLDLVAIKAQTHATLTGLRAMMRYYSINKDTSLLNATIERFALYKREAMTETYENYNWFGRPTWTEPCAVVDAYLLAISLWQNTGNVTYIEDAQKMYYNGLSFEQREHGGFGNSTCAGASNCMIDMKAHDIHWCCNMRGGEGLAVSSRKQVFKGENDIYFTQFGQGAYTLRFGNDSLLMNLSGNYPYIGKVYFEVTNNTLKNNPAIHIFVPSWISDPVVSINGNIVKFEIVNQFITFTPELKDGDFIEYTFKIKSQKVQPDNIHSIKGYSKYMYGPLVMGRFAHDSIPAPGNLTFIPATKELFKTKESDLHFNPVCHPMNADVEKKDFRVQVMFKD